MIRRLYHHQQCRRAISRLELAAGVGVMSYMHHSEVVPAQVQTQHQVEHRLGALGVTLAACMQVPNGPSR